MCVDGEVVSATDRLLAYAAFFNSILVAASLSLFTECSSNASTAFGPPTEEVLSLTSSGEVSFDDDEDEDDNQDFLNDLKKGTKVKKKET